MSAPKVVSLQTKESWQKYRYQAVLRRTAPQIYTGSRDLIDSVSSRVDFLRQTPPISTSTVAEVRVAFEPADITLSTRGSLTDECIIYTSISGFNLRPTFIGNDGDEGDGKTFKFTFMTKKDKIQGEYIAIIDTGNYYQDFILIRIDDEYKTNQIIVYRDKMELRDIVVPFRDIARLNDYAVDEIPFIDGSTVSPEELHWHYVMVMRQFENLNLDWQGVRCPVVVLPANENISQVTQIWRPYVHFNVTINQPLEEQTQLFIETKKGLYSLHCLIPPNCVSIGMPAVSNRSGLIIKFFTSSTTIEKMEVLAFDYPLRTPLSGALPWTKAVSSSSSLTDLPDIPDLDDSSDYVVTDDLPSFSLSDIPIEPLPDDVPPIVQDLPDLPPIDDFFDFDGSFATDDLVQSCIRVHTKDWIEGELQENPPMTDNLVSFKEKLFFGLQKFSLYYKGRSTHPQSILSDGKSVLELRQPWTPSLKLKEKKKYRMRASYVLNGRPHTYKLKFKTTNIHGEPLSYLFELPGPIHLHLVLVDATKDKGDYVVDRATIDVLNEEEEKEVVTPVVKQDSPVEEDDDEKWLALALA